MRIIRTTFTREIKDFDQPHELITNELMDKLFDPINKNKIYIFDTTGSIEWKLDKIIAHYFYGNYNETNKEFRNKFNSLVLSSDWCTFASKRKLIVHIVNELKLLEGEEKDGYEKLLQKTMSYRNAFAHGGTSTDGRIIKLKYYEGRPMEKTLDQAYFDKVEETLNECYRLTRKIAKTLGIMKNE